MTLKDLVSPSVVALKPSASEMLDRVELLEKDYDFLYNDADTAYLQDKETFENFEVPMAIFGDREAVPFLECNVSYDNFNIFPSYSWSNSPC